GLGGRDGAPAAMARDLDANWEVLAEAVQSVMRVHGLEQPYERLKELTRGRRIDGPPLRGFVEALRPPADARERLLALTPATYTGLAAELVERFGGDRS